MITSNSFPHFKIVYQINQINRDKKIYNNTCPQIGQTRKLPVVYALLKTI